MTRSVEGMPSMFQGQARSCERQLNGSTCWPMVWLWVLAIAQYSYRYILQVSDPNSSMQYAATPPALSAIKYALLLLFATYALSRRSASMNRTYRHLLAVLTSALAILTLVVLIRLMLLPGDLDQTATCAAELAPWMASLFFMPFVFRPEHSLIQTLAAFERITFWVAFPFWLATILLATFGIRYPALSYPGLLLRFGGILDDPNGYACLCLFLMVVAVSGRARHWKLRVSVYIAMLLATLSLAGYTTAIIMGLGFLLRRILTRRVHRPSMVVRTLAVCAALSCVVVLVIATSQTSEAVEAISSLYAAKSYSAATHLSNLLPEEAAWDASSPVALLCGTGGFSENFYWRLLANFGWTGLLAILTVIGTSFYFAFQPSKRWASALGLWAVALLIGSNGIAYLLTFPINLIYWSFTAALVLSSFQTKSPQAALR
jgi:hypothetical protein